MVLADQGSFVLGMSPTTGSHRHKDWRTEARSRGDPHLAEMKRSTVLPNEDLRDVPL